jgi:double-stranded uracil-DNA glycosylase
VELFDHGEYRVRLSPDARPEMKVGLAPIAHGNAQVLILGSLPGEASLAVRQYYAHPTNHFWRLMEAVTDRSLVSLAYDDKIDTLRQCGIALWDMVAEGTREGSLDQSLKAYKTSDVTTLARSLPYLQLIAFNGGKAASLGARLVGIDDVERIQLPSSSAANTTPFAQKLLHWRRIAEFLV